MFFTLASIVVALVLADLVRRFILMAPAANQDQALGQAITSGLLWLLIFVGWIVALVVWALNHQP